MRQLGPVLCPVDWNFETLEKHGDLEMEPGQHHFQVPL